MVSSLATRASANILKQIADCNRIVLGLLLILTVYAGVSTLVQQLTNVDNSVFADLLKGFADLLPTRPFVQPAVPQAPTWYSYVGLIVPSIAAIWIGYRMTMPVRLIVLAQLFMLGLLYQWACWQWLHSPGHPVSLACTVTASLLFGCLQKAIAEQKRHNQATQIELNLRNRELQESRLALVKQDETEKRLLSADLHDQVLNDLRNILSKFEQYADNPTLTARETIRSSLKQTMNDVRGIMDDLCPILLSEFGLPAAIEDRLDKAAQTAGVDVRFNQKAEARELDALSDVEQQLLYRLVQECITNVCKHAQASIICVAITREDDQLIFRIQDNGRGIDRAKLSDSSRGTLYMRLRAALIAANILWKEGPDGKGTTVEIRMESRLAMKLQQTQDE